MYAPSWILTAIAAQSVMQDQPPVPLRPGVTVQGDTIVVEGATAAEEKRLRESVVTGFNAPGYRADNTAREFEVAERAAKCAARGKVASRAQLRAVVDGAWNSSAHDRAQDRLVVQTATCGAGSEVLSRGGAIAQGSEPGSLSIRRVNPISYASVSEEGVLARGAFVIEAIRRFAPDLALTRDQLHAPEVVHRFIAREEPQARLRIASDLRFFKVAACLVQRTPEATIDIVRSERSPYAARMTIARMIDTNRDCVGGARKVSFDPFQFRVYLADALYRWALAARGVDTLIPPDAE